MSVGLPHLGHFALQAVPFFPNQTRWLSPQFTDYCGKRLTELIQRSANVVRTPMRPAYGPTNAQMLSTAEAAQNGPNTIPTLRPWRDTRGCSPSPGIPA